MPLGHMWLGNVPALKWQEAPSSPSLYLLIGHTVWAPLSLWKNLGPSSVNQEGQKPLAKTVSSQKPNVEKLIALSPLKTKRKSCCSFPDKQCIVRKLHLGSWSLRCLPILGWPCPIRPVMRWTSWWQEYNVTDCSSPDQQETERQSKGLGTWHSSQWHTSSELALPAIGNPSMVWFIDWVFTLTIQSLTLPTPHLWNHAFNTQASVCWLHIPKPTNRSYWGIWG